jgi:hypothetical protein
MVLHETEDTTAALSQRIAPQFNDRTLAYLVALGTIAIVAALLTRGTLGYRRAPSVLSAEAHKTDAEPNR